MAANVTIVGRTSRVRGRLTGTGDVEVQGFVEGEIAVSGDVTVDAHGLVGASVRGRRVTIRGAVQGDLHGEEAVLLEDGARVVGDVRAPRVSIATGALIRGYVETGDGGAAAARPPRATAVARPAPFVQAKAAPAPAAASAARVGPPPLPKKVSAAPSASASGSQAQGAVGPSNGGNSGVRRPPPPVVPAMKKAKGQIAKKKER
jgi:cytoskeletal protein CcmA (bactofilin family)